MGSELGLMVDDALAEAGLNFTGAMAILNVGSWETWVREVLSHEPGELFNTLKNTQTHLEIITKPLQKLCKNIKEYEQGTLTGCRKGN